MDNPIPLFSPFYRTDECLSEIRECLEKGWTGLGYKTIEFEEKWKEYTGLPNAHFVNSCTAALHLAVEMLKWQRAWAPGDEIITTPLTFVSTNHAILHAGLKPVFADVDRYLCLDPDAIQEQITRRTRAIMFVGHGGNSGSLPEVIRIAKERNLAVILDAAHMAGTRISGCHAGHDVDAAAFSFHSVKNVPTADGGMISFRSSNLAAKVRKMSWLGISQDTFTRMGSGATYRWMYDVEDVGWKYHGNSVMAALGIIALRYLDVDNGFRRQLAAWYRECLGPEIDSVPVPEDCQPSGLLFQILVDRRNELMAHLNQAGIFPGVHYQANTDYPMYDEAQGSCPRAEQAARRLISLPVHLRMGRNEVERICSCIRGFLK
jgi:dTDP-4-amino-4,6-dideoxygalactose transaminase